MPNFRKANQDGFDHVLLIVAFMVIFAIAGTFLLVRSHAAPMSRSSSQNKSFNFGYDFAYVEPDWYHTNAQSDAQGLKVLASTPGAIVDQTLYGEGVSVNPEPSYGNYNASDFAYPDNSPDHSLGSRVTMIANAKDTPAITLLGAPSWMYGCATMANDTATGNCASCYKTGGGTASCTKSPCDPDTWDSSTSNPPCPAYYEDYAQLAAHVAASLPQVKYFVVWNEFKGFMNNHAVDAAHYTALYNDVYAAIKKVRPDAMVGGPYAPLGAGPLSPGQSCNGFTLCSNEWGWVPQYIVNGFSYWLAHKVRADFVAVDGPTEIATANNGYGDNTVAASPLDASLKYAAVDRWISRQTALPIWWMESHIQPCNSSNGNNCDPSTSCGSNTCWTDKQAAASRIATLALMNASGASVGMWWQPEQEPRWQDQGLWTTTLYPGGGQPTTLDKYLNQTAAILRQPLKLVGGQKDGVLVAITKTQVLIVNTLAKQTTATGYGRSITLAPGQIVVASIPSGGSK